MRFTVAVVGGLVACAQSAAAAQGPGVAPGQAGFVAQVLAASIIGALAVIVLFGLLKIVLVFARPR